jgi:hypothetical protein
MNFKVGMLLKYNGFNNDYYTYGKLYKICEINYYNEQPLLNTNISGTHLYFTPKEPEFIDIVKHRIFILNNIIDS